MKITVVFLLVAVCCFFDPATSHCMSRCAKSCWQPHITDMTCLQTALRKNMPAAVSALSNFLCTYDRSKAMKNKTELIRAIRNLKDVTQCSLDNILGNEITIEELSADVNGILQYLLRTVVDLLSGLNIGTLTVPLCGPLQPLLTKVSQILYILGVPRLNGQIQTIAGINGGKHLLQAIANRSPGLVKEVLHLLLGPIYGLSEVIGLIGGVGKTVGGLTTGLGGVTKSLNGGQGAGLPVGLGGVNNLLFGVTDGIGGLTSRFLEGTEFINGLTKGNEETTGGLTSVLGLGTNALGGVTDILPFVPAVTGLAGTVNGAIETVEAITGGLLGPTSGLSGITGLLGKGTDLLGGLTGANKSGNRGSLKDGSVVNENILANQGMGANLYADGKLMGGVGVAENFYVQPDVSLDSSMTEGSTIKNRFLTAEQSSDTSRGLLQVDGLGDPTMLLGLIGK